MIVDIDKKGQLSITELDRNEQTAIFEALVRFNETLCSTKALIGDNGFTERMKRASVKLISAISIVTAEQSI